MPSSWIVLDKHGTTGLVTVSWLLASLSTAFSASVEVLVGSTVIFWCCKSHSPPFLLACQEVEKVGTFCSSNRYQGFWKFDMSSATTCQGKPPISGELHACQEVGKVGTFCSSNRYQGFWKFDMSSATICQGKPPISGELLIGTMEGQGVFLFVGGLGTGSLLVWMPKGKQKRPKDATESTTPKINFIPSPCLLLQFFLFFSGLRFHVKSAWLQEQVPW